MIPFLGALGLKNCTEALFSVFPLPCCRCLYVERLPGNRCTQGCGAYLLRAKYDGLSSTRALRARVEYDKNMDEENEAAITEGKKLALNGKSKEAEDYFRNLSKKGIPEASVALAQIFAFQGKWNEVLDHGKVFLQNPHISYNYWPFQEAMRKLITRAVKITGRESQFEVMLEWSGAVARATLSSEVWAVESFQKGLDDMAVAVGLKEKEEPAEDESNKEPELSKEEKIKKYEQEIKKTIEDPVLGKDLKHVAKIRCAL